MGTLSTKLVKLIITPHALVTSFIINILYSSVLTDTSVGFFSSTFLLNWAIAFGISWLINIIVRGHYNPTYFNRDKLTISDVIRRNTMAGAKFDPMYKQEEYKIHFEFDVAKISLYLTFFLFLFAPYVVGYAHWDSSKLLVGFGLLVMYTFFMQTIYLIAYDIKYSINLKTDKLLYTLIALLVVSGIGLSLLNYYITI